MFGIGPVELLVVFVVALLVFGPTKLPELARSLGKGLREFRKASSDLRRSMEFDDDDASPPSAPAQAGSPHEPPEPGSTLDQVEAAAAQSAATESSQAEAESRPDSSSPPKTEPSSESLPTADPQLELEPVPASEAKPDSDDSVTEKVDRPGG